MIILKLFKEYRELKHKHDILKRQVLNNQSVDSHNQSKLHRDFLQRKNKFKSKYNKY